MTLRERIADWISGGALTRLEEERLDTMRSMNRLMRAHEASMRESAGAWNEMQSRLDRIRAEVARQKAPNATVRRLGRIAEGKE